MNPKELKQIKARCEAAKSVPVHCKRCKWFTDLPKCVAEIERLQKLVKRAYREGGELAFKDRMFDEDNYCWDHSKAREALEAE